MVNYCWLSFANKNGWLGGCFIQSDSEIEAVNKSHKLGINPGGQVLMTLLNLNKKEQKEFEQEGLELNHLYMKPEDIPGGFEKFRKES